ncbi:MAG: PepSY-associated TM helix domain-containing protein [Bacteroidota bacterium]
MKNKRDYNVFFNTHTVSGIVISVGLFVIFLAGAFALFLDEINHWQEAKQRAEYRTDVDYDRVLSIVEEEGYNLEGRNMFISYRENGNGYIQINSQALKVDSDSSQVEATSSNTSSADSIAKASIFMRINPDTYEVQAKEYKPNTAHLGDFLYHLHYFRQIPVVGIYIAGLVALFFAFAIFTGIIVHWNKIVSNFFTFRLKASLKNLWTDAHTALGVLGLPFQLMYAITGAYFGIAILLYIPIVTIVFDGDQNKAFEMFRPKAKDTTGDVVVMNEDVKINPLVEESLAEVEGEEISFVFVQLSNFGKEEAQLAVNTRLAGNKHFLNNVRSNYRLADGALLAHKPVDENSYVESVSATMGKLHFAQFGGYLVKTVYFVLAIITCFVIITGVLIWLAAREKKMYAHKANFNRNVGAIYLGACLGLYPAIALFFCMVKIFPLEMEGRFEIMEAIFFLSWLAFTIYAFIIKSNYKINQHALILAGVMGILIPVFSGLQSGLWLWKSLYSGYVDSFFIDVAWLCLGIISLVIALNTKPLETKKIVRKKLVSSSVTGTVPKMVKAKVMRPRVKEEVPVLKIRPTQS